MRKLSIGACVLAVALSPLGSVVSQDTFTVLGSFEGTLVPGTQIRGFASESDAEEAMMRVLRYAGLRPNFVFGRDDAVGNAAAGMVQGPAGQARMIAYNAQFMRRLRNASGTEWALFGVLAHELGHHLQGHTLAGTGSHPAIELEADEYAGFLLNRMGSTLDEALAAFASGPERGGSTHPDRRDRLRAVANGWNDAQRQMGGARTPSSGSSSRPPPSPPPAGSASPSADAAAAREAIVRLEAALGNRLDDVEEILRNDLAQLNADLTAALAASEAKVIGAIAAGARETTEAIRSAVTEEARLTREAVAAEGLLTRETVVAESSRTREDVNRVMWLFVAFSAIVLPMLLLLTFRRPRQQLVRVVERASTRARSLIHRDTHGVPQAYPGRAPTPAPRAPSPQGDRMAAGPALMLVAGREAGTPRQDILVPDQRLRSGGREFLIGRHAPAVHAVVDDPTVSRSHARITREAGRFFIEDLGSSNGTLVNGARLRPGEKQVIRSGDSVQFGGMGAFSVRAM